jgi:hypothetical protein
MRSSLRLCDASPSAISVPKILPYSLTNSLSGRCEMIMERRARIAQAQARRRPNQRAGAERGGASRYTQDASSRELRSSRVAVPILCLRTLRLLSRMNASSARCHSLLRGRARAPVVARTTRKALSYAAFLKLRRCLRMRVARRCTDTVSKDTQIVIADERIQRQVPFASGPEIRSELFAGELAHPSWPALPEKPSVTQHF